MSQEMIFSLTSGLALLSWVFLAFFPFKPFTTKLIPGISITLLCIAYTVLVFSTLKIDDFQKFNTLNGISSLMSVPGAALLGWIHYLAFDLMIGLFIANNAQKHGIKHLYILPCLFLTLMLGPVGLLLYFLVRWTVTNQYFANNF